MAEYERSYHQFKFLSLLALILTHSISFVNQTTAVPLETVPGFLPLEFFISLGTHFIPLAGIAFRLALDPFVSGDRLVDPPAQMLWPLVLWLAWMPLL